MKKFIKAVVVASVLVSASSAFATISKSSATGTGGVTCPHKANPFLFDATADQQVAAAAKQNVKVINGTVVK